MSTTETKAINLDNAKRERTGSVRVMVSGRKYTVGGAASYAKSYNESPVAAVERCIRLDHKVIWISEEGTMLCDDPSYYAREQAAWADAPVLSDGDVIVFDGYRGTVRRDAWRRTWLSDVTAI